MRRRRQPSFGSRRRAAAARPRRRRSIAAALTVVGPLIAAVAQARSASANWPLLAASANRATQRQIPDLDWATAGYGYEHLPGVGCRFWVVLRCEVVAA